MVQSNPLFNKQWHFGQIGNVKKIWREHTGEGVSVAVYDDGVERSHPDLNDNYDGSRHFQSGSFSDDGQPNGSSDSHGTAVAGIIASENNTIGGVGVAYDASITGVTLLTDVSNQGPSTSLAALRYASAFDVANHSWGYTPTYDSFLNLNNVNGAAFQEGAAFDHAAATGRGGLGTVSVKAAGNDANNPSLQSSGILGNAQGEGHNSLHSIITVAATGRSGRIEDYSNWGSNLLVAAPAASVTTDLAGSPGYASGNYTETFGGTSAASPVVAGVVALMLEANPNLGWRDVQMILANSAAHTGSDFGGSATGFEVDKWFSNGATTWNGGGMSYSLSYGFGLVDAHAAVRMAEIWDRLYDTAHVTANTQVVSASSSGGRKNITDNATTRVDVDVTQNVVIEHIYVNIDGYHTYSGDLTITLVAPDGTRFLLFDEENGSSDFEGWVFGVSGAMNMKSSGQWRVLVTDSASGDIGYIDDVTLEFHGSAVSKDTVHHITDDFTEYASKETERRTITDRDGGSDDWLNMAAVTGDVALSMKLGGKIEVDNESWGNLANNALIENAATGDGNDSIEGNAAANEILGRRGNDTITGGNGQDNLVGSSGRDQLFGQNDDDLVRGGNGDDLVNGGHGNDHLVGGRGKDTVIGGPGSDTISGGDGHDTVKGGTGRDQVELGAGNDRYSDTSQGGTNGRDTVNGGSGNDTINAGAGNDTLIGGKGNDVLNGTGGSDVFVFANDFGRDRIVRFDALDDDEVIDLSQVSAITDLNDLVNNHMSQSGSNVVIDAGGGNTITLVDVRIADLDANDFVF